MISALMFITATFLTFVGFLMAGVCGQKLEQGDDKAVREFAIAAFVFHILAAPLYVSSGVQWVSQ